MFLDKSSFLQSLSIVLLGVGASSASDLLMSPADGIAGRRELPAWSLYVLHVLD